MKTKTAKAKKEAEEESSVYKIAQDTFHEFLARGHDFSYKEISAEVIRRGGINRYTHGMTLGERLTELEEKGDLMYIPRRDIFIVNFEAGHLLAKGVILCYLTDGKNFFLADLMKGILRYVKTSPETLEPRLAAYLKQLDRNLPWFRFNKNTGECTSA